MKFFIDTANLDQIREAAALGVLDGVTTNPSLMAKEGISGDGAVRQHYVDICNIVDGDVSAEVISTNFEDMVREGEALAALHDNIVVKVPMIEDGVKALRYFSDKGIRTNCTLVFSAGQALLAAKAGADYVSPFIGRLDDISTDGLQADLPDPRHLRQLHVQDGDPRGFRAPHHARHRVRPDRRRRDDRPALGHQGLAQAPAHRQRTGEIPRRPRQGGRCRPRLSPRTTATQSTEGRATQARPSSFLCPMRLAFGFLLVLCSLGILRAQPVCTFVGDAASLGGDCYQITDNNEWELGAVWFNEQLDLDQPFTINVDVNLGSQDANGADGVVFVMQSVGPLAIGDAGGGLGFEGFNPSFGVEIDTWQNTDIGDLSLDHVAFHRDGINWHNAPYFNLAGPVPARADGANIEDGQDHRFKLVWDPAVDLVEFYFDCELRLSLDIDLVTEIFDGQPRFGGGSPAPPVARAMSSPCASPRRPLDCLPSTPFARERKWSWSCNREEPAPSVGPRWMG